MKVNYVEPLQTVVDLSEECNLLNNISLSDEDSDVFGNTKVERDFDQASHTGSGSSIWDNEW